MTALISSLFFFLSYPSQASSLASVSPFVDLPKGCFTAKIFPCALRSTGGTLKFERPTGSFQLGDLSSLRFITLDKFQLLSGSLWIEKSQQLSLVANPQLKLVLNGEFFLQKQKESTIMVRNLNGTVDFQSSFLLKEEALPVGFQNWFGTLTAQKQISRGILRPIEVLPFLKDWHSVAGLSPAQAKARAQVYRHNWAEGVEISSQFYKEVVERSLASQAEADQRRGEQSQAVLNEKTRIRKMYRQKAGFDD